MQHVSWNANVMYIEIMQQIVLTYNYKQITDNYNANVQL